MSNVKLVGKKFSGTAYARKFGTEDAFQEFGNMVELTTSASSEKDELKSTKKENYGQALSVDNTQNPTEVTLKSNSYDKYAMARILMGEAVDLTSGVQQITGQQLTVKTKGWIRLSHKDVKASSIAFTDESNNPIDPGKYKINENLGMVYFNDDSGLDGAVLSYTGETKGTGGYAVQANSINRIDLEMYVDLKDRVNGNEGVLELSHLVLTSDGSLNWFSDGWMETGLKGTLVLVDDKPAMEFIEFDAVI